MPEQPAEFRRYTPEKQRVIGDLTYLTTAFYLEQVTRVDNNIVNFADRDQAISFWERQAEISRSPLQTLALMADRMRTDLQASLEEMQVTKPSELGRLLSIGFNTLRPSILSDTKAETNPYTNILGGFGSGTISLLQCQVLEGLYGQANFDALTAASTISRIDFRYLADAQQAIGFVADLDSDQNRQFSLIKPGIKDDHTLHFLDKHQLEAWGLRQVSGCVALQPPSQELRPHLPDGVSHKASIPQLNEYVSLATNHLITWLNHQDMPTSQLLHPKETAFFSATDPNLPTEIISPQTLI